MRLIAHPAAHGDLAERLAAAQHERLSGPDSRTHHVFMRRQIECLFEHAAELTVAQVHVPREFGDSEPLLQIFGDEARDAPRPPRGQALISEKWWLINDDSELAPFACMLEHWSSPLPQVLDVGSLQVSC